jgi:hypothetical protein
MLSITWTITLLRARFGFERIELRGGTVRDQTKFGRKYIACSGPAVHPVRRDDGSRSGRAAGSWDPELSLLGAPHPRARLSFLPAAFRVGRGAPLGPARRRSVQRNQDFSHCDPRILVGSAGGAEQSANWPCLANGSSRCRLSGAVHLTWCAPLKRFQEPIGHWGLFTVRYSEDCIVAFNAGEFCEIVIVGGRRHHGCGLPLESRAPPVGRVAPARRSVFHVHDATVVPVSFESLPSAW